MHICKTKLLYLDTMYLYQAEAKVIELLNLSEKVAIVLDQTIFYPQSGGQPSDKGIIIKNNEAEFEVEKVVFDNNYVQHLGNIKKGNFEINDKVICM